MDDWTLKDAQTRFGEIADRAHAGEPQRVTLDGGKTVEIVAVEDEVQPAQTAEEFVAALRSVIFDDPVEFERIDYPALPRPIILPDD